MLGGDVALVRADQPFAGGRALDACDGGVAVDLGAERPRSPGERLGQVGGLDVAVVGVLDRADQAIGLAKRPDRLDFRGREHIDRDADRPGDAGVIHVLVEAVPGPRQTDVGDLAEADILSGLGLEPPVEADRVFVDLPDRVGEVEQRQEAGGMPGRARGQFLALAQDDIGPALAGEVIEGRDADDAAPDHDDAGMSSHQGNVQGRPETNVPSSA